MGVISFNGETYPGAHEVLIDRQLFDAVQHKMHKKRPAKQRKHDLALRNVLTCGHCGKTITWQRQKGHFYGSCQRDTAACKANRMLREETINELLESKLESLITPDPDLLNWLINNIKTEYKEGVQNIDNYKESMRVRVKRLQGMEDMLYDDKLVGDITVERYQVKKQEIEQQIKELSDDLTVADATIATKHEDAIDIIELSQTAYAQYKDYNLDNEKKRTVLTKLFDSVVHANNTVSVTYSFLAQSIAKRSEKSRQIIGGKDMRNQTNKKDPN